MEGKRHIYYDYLKPYIEHKPEVKVIMRNVGLGGGVIRELVELGGTQFKFIHVSLLVSRLNYKKDEATGVRVYKLSIPPVMKVNTKKETGIEVPVMSLWVCCDGFGEYGDVLIDFSDSDMSNLKHIEFKCADRGMNYNIDFKFPQGKGKPELFSITCRNYELDIDPIIRELDLSSVVGMYMFRSGTSITEFDFGKLNIPEAEDFGRFFDGCSNLKSVRGNIGTKASSIKTQEMFNRCFSLESIGEDIFDGVKITEAKNMFYGLGRNKNNLVVNAVINIVKRSNKSDMASALNGMTGGVILEKHSLKYCDLQNLFLGTDLDYFDMRKLKLRGNQISIVSMFSGLMANFESMISSSLINSITAQTFGTVDTNIPKIVVVGRNFTPTKKDLGRYELIDMGDLSDDELKLKIQLMKIMDNDKNYILRCD